MIEFVTVNITWYQIKVMLRCNNISFFWADCHNFTADNMAYEKKTDIIFICSFLPAKKFSSFRYISDLQDQGSLIDKDSSVVSTMTPLFTLSLTHILRDAHVVKCSYGTFFFIEYLPMPQIVLIEKATLAKWWKWSWKFHLWFEFQLCGCLKRGNSLSLAGIKTKCLGKSCLPSRQTWNVSHTKKDFGEKFLMKVIFRTASALFHANK